jgi:heme A synthase
MKTKLWLATGAATLLVAASGVVYISGIQYVPSILMFIAALIVMGVAMTAEDSLLRKYDTPHDDDTHPPQLVTLRAVRSILLIAMIVVAIAMLF